MQPATMNDEARTLPSSRYSIVLHNPEFEKWLKDVAPKVCEARGEMVPIEYAEYLYQRLQEMKF